MTTARGMPTAAHSSQSILVSPSTPSVAATANSAASAARRPARRSPVKSAYPGVSSRLTLTPAWTSGASVRLTERCCLISTSSKSLTVVPSSTRPARWMVPVATSSASTSVVLPAPEWPTSTTLRTPTCWPAAGAPPAALDPFLSAIVCLLPGFVRLRHDQPLPHGHRTTTPQPESPGRCYSRAAARRGAISCAVRGPCASRADTRIRTAMLNVLRPYLARLLTPVGEALARTPITPNAVTITGTCGMVAGALWLFPTGHLFAGTMVCTGFVLADMLDGVLARVKGTSGTWGAFLDSTLDRIGDAAVFAGLAIWLARTGQGVLAEVALFCLVVGGLVSYAKARAEGLGLRCDVGIAERSERLLIALTSAGLAGLGVPYVLAIGLWGLATARDWFVDRAYALGWALVCRVPESWARSAFRLAGDIAWRRQGRGVQRLEANLRRVIGPRV